MSRRGKKQRQATCGGCGFVGPASKRWRFRGKWARCPECVAAYTEAMRAHRDLDAGFIRAAGDKVQMGWNGVPSDKSLRRRPR